jgi:hypothetical protein
MIKIILENTMEKEFYLEDAKEVARTLIDLGYELEPNARIVDDELSPEKVNALLRLLRQANADVYTTVTITT